MIRFISPKFTDFIVVVGIALFIWGITSFFIWNSKAISIILTFLGIYMGFSHTGFDIDLKKRKFKYFTSQFGIREGNWKYFRNYPYLSILSIGQKQIGQSFTGVTFTSRSVVFRIYLLNQKHTEKILIKEFNKEKKAKDFAKRIAKEFDLQIKTYRPDFTKTMANIG